MKKKYIYFILTLTVILWGISFAVVKLGMGDLYPVQFLFIRTIFATIIFALILSKMPKEARSIDKSDRPYLFYLGFMGIAGYFIIQYTALNYTTTVNASLLVGLAPIFVAIYSSVFLKEKLGIQRIAGIGICFIGIVLIVTKGDISNLTFGKTMIGDALIIINAVMLAAFSIGAKRMLNKYEPFIVVAYLNMYAMIMLIPVVIIKNPISPIPIIYNLQAIDANALWAALFLGSTCTVFAYYAWYSAIKEIGATKTSVFNYINPLVASIVSFLIFDEGITVFTIVGGLCIILGVTLNNMRNLFTEKHSM